MFALNATQQAILDSASKKISWLFSTTDGTEVFDWSTKNYTFNSRVYENRILPKSFNGLTFNSGVDNLNIMASGILTFEISDPDDDFTPSDFYEQELTVRLVVNNYSNEEQIGKWIFTITQVRKHNGKIKFTCNDFLSKYLNGSYPNTPLVSSLAPSDDNLPNDNLCLPVTFGECYIPTRSIYITDARYYIIGYPSNGGTWTINEFRSPIDWGSLSIWDDSYTYTQATKTIDSVDYRVVSPVIVDADHDDVLDSTGLFFKGGRFLDGQIKLFDSKKLSLIDYPDVIEYVLEDMGVPSSLIDTDLTKGEIYAEDTCSVDRTDESVWIEGANTTLAFDTDHYTIEGDGGTMTLIYRGGSVTGDEALKISFEIKDGTTSAEGILQFEDGDMARTVPGGNWSSTSEWVKWTYYITITASNATSDISFIDSTDLGGDNFQLRNFKVESIESQDVCAEDLTHNWGEANSASLDFDTDHYEFESNAVNGNVFVYVSFVAGRKYRVSVEVKDGTESGADAFLRYYNASDSGNSDEFATTGSFIEREFYFEAQVTGVYQVQIRTTDDWSGNNIEFRNFIVSETSSFAYHKNVTLYNRVHFCRGAFVYKEDRRKIIDSLLTQCACIFRITDKIELHPLAKTSVKSITEAMIRSKGEGKESSYDYRSVNKDYFDSAYVAYREADTSQLILKQVLVMVDGNSDNTDNKIIETPFITSSQDSQRVGVIGIQRKYGILETVTFNGRDDLLVIQPDDVITISDSKYDGSFTGIAKIITINKDLTIAFQIDRIGHSLLDWEDLTPDAVTLGTDDSTYIFRPVISGPDDDTEHNHIVERLWVGDNILLDGENGSITTYVGGDITLIGDDSNPGIIIFQGSSNELKLGCTANGLIFDITPTTANTLALSMGSTTEQFLTVQAISSYTNKQHVYYDSNNEAYVYSYHNSGGDSHVTLAARYGGANAQAQLINDGSIVSFFPSSGTVDLGTATYPWNDIHGTDLYLDGNVGLGGSGALSTVGIRRVDATLDTNAAFYALQLSTTKTAGASDQNDSYRTANLTLELDQSGGVFGASYGIVNSFILSDGDIGTVGSTKSALGMQNSFLQSDGLITGNAFGLYNINDYDGGTINGNSYGLYNRLDQESGHTIGGNVFGMFLYSAFDGTVTGNTYVIYSNEVSGVDFFIYQAGTATSRFGGTIDIVTTIDRTDHIKIENTGTVEHGYIGNDSSSLFLASGVYYDGASWQFDDAGSLPAVIQIKGFDGTIDFRTLGSQGSPLNRMRIKENGVVLIGDVAGGDYTKVEADGTVEFNGDGTVWNDIQFPVSAGKQPTSSAPTWTALTGTSFNGEYAFDINEYIDLASNELVHSWKEGTAGNFHAHISIPTANSSGASRYATVNLYVAHVNSSDVWTETLLSGDLEIPDGSVAGENFYLDLGDLTLTGLLIGTQIKCRVRRVATGAGTEYGSDIFIHQVGCHVEEDTVGSRTEASK